MRKVFLCFVLFLVITVQAGTIYVKPALEGGNDETGNGTSWETAYATPTKAFGSAVNGDVVAVKRGIYNTNVALSNAAKATNVLLQGGYTGNGNERVIDPQNTILDYTGSTIPRVLGDYGAGLILSGITFQNLQPVESQYGIFVNVGANAPLTLEDCVLKNFVNKAGSYIRGIIRFNATSKITINRCRFIDCEEKSAANHNAVITRNGGSATVIIKNSIIQGTKTKPFISGGAGGSNTHTIVNCTFIDNPGGAGTNLGTNFTTTISNSIFYNSALSGTGSLKSSFYNGGIGSLTPSNSVKFTAASDVFADEVDYYPAAVFAGIDNGDNFVDAGDKDIAGNTRTVNSTIDIGAYENIPAPIGVAGANIIEVGLATNPYYVHGAVAELPLTIADGCLPEPIEGVQFSGKAPDYIATLTVKAPRTITFSATQGTSEKLEVIVNITDSHISLQSPVEPGPYMVELYEPFTLTFTVDSGVEPMVKVNGVKVLPEQLTLSEEGLYTLTLSSITEKTIIEVAPKAVDITVNVTDDGISILSPTPIEPYVIGSGPFVLTFRAIEGIEPIVRIDGVEATSEQLSVSEDGIFTLTLSSITEDTVIEITPRDLEIKQFLERIVEEAHADRISSVINLDGKVDSHLALLKENGSFPDVNYAATDRTDWPPMPHLDRMLEMGLAYTYPASSYYGDAALKAKLDLMLAYWQSQAPRSSNWYQNEIGEPQRMGLYLILVQLRGAEKIPTTLFDKAIIRLRDKGGNPGSQTGANRVDVALHWMYRACLTEDRELLQTAMDYIYSPIAYTTGTEGIQYDNSYTQHGRQLHLGSYGEVFLDGITKTASYAVGTAFALPNDKLAVLSKLVKDSYLNTLRGNNISYNVIGRASTRPGATIKGKSKTITRMASIDSENASVYIAANERLAKIKPVDYEVTPGSTHYFKTDYSLHKRPHFMVDLRMVSTRTARNEYLSDNLEGKKQYFLSDGSTGIFVKGDEYANIFPVWNWAKIPGVTCPEFTSIPQASTYIKMGQSELVGGVSDSTYSVSVYKYTDNEFKINSSANKSWFFFDKEVVCLGSDIKSSSEFKVNTTLNQCLKDGEITVSVNQAEEVLIDGTYSYNNAPDWVYHGGVGYYFPTQGKVDLTAVSQTGNWFDINGNYSSDLISKDVFTLSFDHGVQPDGAEYAYIIVPGLADKTEAKNYNPSTIEILANTDSLQAVYNNESGVLGLVFYKGCEFNAKGVSVETDAPCVMMIKDIDKASSIVHVSDPLNSNVPVKIGISTPLVTKKRLITYQAGAPYQGSSLRFLVNEDSPIYTGKDVLLDRSDWTIIASSQGPVDATVAVDGDVPGYMIDGDNKSAFLFVKPTKSMGGVSVPAGAEVSFTIDMKKSSEMTYMLYRHRDYSNTQSMLRASKGSFYGKNTEEEEFQPIIQNFNIATDVTEVRVDLPAKVLYRYVKFVMEEWDTSSGNTIQVSEFNLGNNKSSDIGTGIFDVNKGEDGLQVTLYPNPIKAGKPFYIRMENERSDASITVYTLSGVKISEYKTGTNIAELKIDIPGMYVVEVKKNGETSVLKTIVN